MKRTVSCILSIILALTFVLLLAGCSDSKKFVGQWKAEVDMTDMVNSYMSEENEEIFKYVKAADITIDLVFTFNSDGTYRMAPDEEAFKETLRTFGQTMAEGLRAYFQDLIETNGLDMSVDEFLVSAGLDLDSLVDEIENGEIFDEDSTSEGNFKAEKGKLYTSDSLNEEIDESEYVSYTIEGDCIILTDAVESDLIDHIIDMKDMEDMEDMDIELFPMKLTRID